VRIQVLRASLEDRKIDFRLVSPRTPATPPGGSGKAYDYAASGERYSLPKKAAATTKAPGMFGRAAKAIGRAFGRKEVEVAAPAPTPAPRKAAVSDNPPPRSSSTARGAQRPARKADASSSRGPRKEASPKRGHAPAAAPTAKKAPRRRPKPKGKS
jgi:ribonuclease R